MEDKRSVLKLVIDKRLPYYRKEGFRTAVLSLPFLLLDDLRGRNFKVVGRHGIEP